ncbi:hypothetical protein ACFQPG_12300 [Sphingomonas sp. GCM10030256]|uniref:hypothetical protein n=1 Tax=Sphingomonas sp. GCM10030256 TaxID=3273427 RepID=UPI00361415EB
MRSITVAACFLALIAPASASAAPHSSKASRTFKVGSATFTGTPKTICVIEGRWADGDPFRYEAWDSCTNMTVTRVPPKSHDQVIEQVLGPNRTFNVPAGSEGFHVGNDYSTVWLFRNKKGEMEEILISD